MSAPQTAEVVDFRTLRDARREREFVNALAKRGLPMRGVSMSESVCLKLEVMEWDLAHWQHKASVARFLNERMLIILRLANERFAASETLLRIAEDECERLRRLLA